MNASHLPECYGGMFPDVLHLAEGRSAPGRVFTVSLQRVGGMFRDNRCVEADLVRWEECRRCPEFEGCYKFAVAKLALESAVHDQ